MPKEFEVLNIELNGKKLIEASAGTGKTFSVALLLLRLVVEKKIPISQILLMTFTNAAVAEMEERIRLFVRQSFAYLNGYQIENDTIREYFDNKTVEERSEASLLLKDALLELDQTSVLTIHAFCSKMLREFSFETGQLFGMEPIEDLDPVIDIHVDHFWRSHVATLSVDVLIALISENFNKEKLFKLLENVLGGKRYFAYDPNYHYSINGYLRNADDTDKEKWIKGLLQTIKCMALQTIIPKIQKQLEENNLIHFDKIIENMNQAIHSENGQSLKEQLRKKFKAVFIDEFQDTDRYQYEIFKSAFIDDNPNQHHTIVFLIADGKQMIYAFRKADMATYFKAKNDIGVSEIYSMKENFRSSENFIKSLNIFFESVDDPFHFESESNRLDYEHISYPKYPKTRGELSGIESPFTIIRTNNIENAMAMMMNHIHGLLSADSNIYIPDSNEIDGKRKIRPSDIGILVRFGFQAIYIKKLLTDFKIPSVKIDDTNILESKEANYILNLLIAMVNRNPGNIRRALISSFTNHTHETIHSLEMDKCSEQFRQYHDHFLKDGIYKAVMAFFKEYGVQQFLLYENQDERGYSNLIQILEILHEAESDKKLSPMDLLSWYKRIIDQKGKGMKIFEERMESDENAVKIITIHKSKGLEYPIVFNPFLDMEAKAKENKLAQFRDENGEYLIMDGKELNKDSTKKELHRKQNEQENRRLIYVALTRAKYACFIYNIHQEDSPSSLTPFIKAISDLNDIKPIKISENEKIDYPSTDFYHSTKTKVLPNVKDYTGTLPKDNWWKMSYTRLSGSHMLYKEKMDPVIHQNELDAFVFNQFPKGAKAGNILHSILERIDFTKDKEEWAITIQDILLFYRLDNLKNAIQLLSLWIENILQVSIIINGKTFSLNQIKNENRINEFEFDFNILEFDTEKIKQIAEQYDVSINQELGTIKGIMNGKMDMFFRHENKYYILDWKTNFLGYNPQDYHAASLETAMSDNNYHLQYLIYTVAAKIYLTSRISTYNHTTDFGGVIYLFARGVRTDSNYGIFTAEPDINVINAMEKEIHKKNILI